MDDHLAGKTGKGYSMGEATWAEARWENWESIASRGCPGALGAHRLGRGGLDERGSNSEHGYGTEGDWKVPSPALGPYSPHNGPRRAGLVLPCTDEEMGAHSGQPGMAQAQSADPKHSLSTALGPGHGGLVLPSGWGTDDKF